MMRARAIQCLDDGVLWMLADGSTEIRPYAGRSAPGYQGEKRGRKPGIGPVGKRILRILGGGPATVPMIARRTGRSEKSLHDAAAYLRTAGLVERRRPDDVGIAANGARAAYEITAAGRRQLEMQR